MNSNTMTRDNEGTTHAKTRNSKSDVDAGTLAQIGALVSAIAASACCWLPLLLIGLGISGSALSAAFEAWRPMLLPLTFVLLGIAFYFTYRRPRSATQPTAGIDTSAEACYVVPKTGSGDKTCCPPADAKGLTFKKFNKVMLWGVTVFVLAFAFFPNYAGYLLEKDHALITTAADNMVVIKINGMICKACAIHVQAALSKVPGIRHVSVSYEQKEAAFNVGPGQDVPRYEILKAISQAGYEGVFPYETGNEEKKP